MSQLKQAAGNLPSRLRNAVLQQTEDAEELHLRVGRGMTVCGETGKEEPVTQDGRPLTVTAEDIFQTLQIATGASYHTSAQHLASGFLPLRGGHRLGITGSVSLQNGVVHAITQPSSLCLRVAHSVQGMGNEVGRAIFAHGIRSTLILSPPAMGKTTLLRELLRLGSEEYGIRIGLADERGEVAALWKGIPQLDVGSRTDVLDGCPKAEGLLLLLRSMSPQLLAADEITAPEDIAALSMAANCGVPILATAHGKTVEELTRRPLNKRLMEEKLFSQVVTIIRAGGKRRYQVEELN